MARKKGTRSSASKKPAKKLSKTQMRSTKGGAAGSAGTGAGKVIFNPFTITKTVDTVSP